MIQIRKLPLASVFGRGIAIASNVILAFFLTNQYGAANAGWYFLAFTMITIVCMIARVGTENEALRLFPAMIKRGLLHEVRVRYRWLRSINLRVTIVTAIVVGAFSLLMYLSSQDIFWMHVLLQSALIPISGISVLSGTVLRTFGFVSIGTLLETGLAQLGTILIATLLRGFGFIEPIGMSMAMVASSLMSVIVALLALRRIPALRATVARRNEFEEPTWRTDGNRLLLMMISSVLHNAIVSAPILVLGWFGASQQVAIYNGAARLAALVGIVPTFQAPHLLPRVSALIGQSQEAAASLVLARAAQTSALMGSAIAVLLTIAANPLLSLLGEEATADVLVLVILAWGQVLVVSFGQINPVMSMAGAGGYSTLGATLVLAIVGLPYFYAADLGGAAGVALVYCGSLIVYAFYGNALLARRKGITAYAYRLR